MAAILTSLASALAPSIVSTLGNLGKGLVSTLGNIGQEKIKKLKDSTYSPYEKRISNLESGVKNLDQRLMEIEEPVKRFFEK